MLIPKGSFAKKPALIQVMAWRFTGTKPIVWSNVYQVMPHDAISIKTPMLSRTQNGDWSHQLARSLHDANHYYMTTTSAKKQRLK